MILYANVGRFSGSGDIYPIYASGHIAVSYIPCMPLVTHVILLCRVDHMTICHN
jgi:hypothetical protein